jgi:hypothetical protein
MKVTFNKGNYLADKTLLQESKFIGSVVRNQPNKPLYEPKPCPKDWFMKDWLTLIVGGVGYINLANQYGYGLNNKAIDYKTVPSIIDRSSPLMWF